MLTDSFGQSCACAAVGFSGERASRRFRPSSAEAGRIECLIHDSFEKVIPDRRRTETRCDPLKMLIKLKFRSYKTFAGRQLVHGNPLRGFAAFLPNKCAFSAFNWKNNGSFLINGQITGTGA